MNTKLLALLSLAVVALLGSAPTATPRPAVAEEEQPIECGQSGSAVTLDDLYGPQLSQVSARDACNKVLYGEMFPGIKNTCKTCQTPQVGCVRGPSWNQEEGGDCWCVVDQLPNVVPPTWLANYQCAGGTQGWVSCSQCTNP